VATLSYILQAAQLVNWSSLFATAPTQRDDCVCQRPKDRPASCAPIAKRAAPAAAAAPPPTAAPRALPPPAQLPSSLRPPANKVWIRMVQNGLAMV
jgi:hypothetical protein